MHGSPMACPTCIIYIDALFTEKREPLKARVVTVLPNYYNEEEKEITISDFDWKHALTIEVCWNEWYEQQDYKVIYGSAAILEIPISAPAVFPWSKRLIAIIIPQMVGTIVEVEWHKGKQKYAKWYYIFTLKEMEIERNGEKERHRTYGWISVPVLLDNYDY